MPGIYVGVDEEGAPAEMRGVGIRIEDGVLVTDGGQENLTAAVPKEVAELEAVCVRLDVRAAATACVSLLPADRRTV